MEKEKGHPIGCPFYGAGDEARTRYLHLGKVALYRMSYTRIGNMAYYTPFGEKVKSQFSIFFQDSSGVVSGTVGSWGTVVSGGAVVSSGGVVGGAVGSSGGLPVHTG